MSLYILPSYFDLDANLSRERAEFLGDLGYTDIRQHIGKISENSKREILSYMKKAKLVRAWMGVVKDPLNQGKHVGTGDWSDGKYRWNDLHVYLVETYNFALPPIFCNYISSLSGDWKSLECLHQSDLETKFRAMESMSIDEYKKYVVRY